MKGEFLKLLDEVVASDRFLGALAGLEGEVHLGLRLSAPKRAIPVVYRHGVDFGNSSGPGTMALVTGSAVILPNF